MGVECVFFDGLVTRAASDEFVQMINSGVKEAGLTGWRLLNLSDGAPVFTFQSFALPPSERVRIYKNEVHAE